MSTRDTGADYKAAMLEEYEAYVRAGRTEDAEHVATALKDLGHDVKGKRTAKKASAPERADQKAPEEAVPEKPSRNERTD